MRSRMWMGGLLLALMVTSASSLRAEDKKADDKKTEDKHVTSMPSDGKDDKAAKPPSLDHTIKSFNIKYKDVVENLEILKSAAEGIQDKLTRSYIPPYPDPDLLRATMSELERLKKEQGDWSKNLAKLQKEGKLDQEKLAKLIAPLLVRLEQAQALTAYGIEVNHLAKRRGELLKKAAPEVWKSIQTFEAARQAHAILEKAKTDDKMKEIVDGFEPEVKKSLEKYAKEWPALKKVGDPFKNLQKDDDAWKKLKADVKGTGELLKDGEMVVKAARIMPTTYAKLSKIAETPYSVFNDPLLKPYMSDKKETREKWDSDFKTLMQEDDDGLKFRVKWLGDYKKYLITSNRRYLDALLKPEEDK